MQSAPLPIYLVLAALCAAYLALAVADKRTAGLRLCYAVVSFLLLLCGQAVLTWGVSRAGIPAEMLSAVLPQRAVTAVLGAWLAMMAAGELARVVLLQRPAVEVLGPVVLVLTGVLLRTRDDSCNPPSPA